MRRLKGQKTLKVEGTTPHFANCKDLLVLVRKGWTLIVRLKVRVFDFECRSR